MPLSLTIVDIRELKIQGAVNIAKDANDPVCQQYVQENPDGGVSEMYNTGHRGF